jgi:hypothetical protein
MKINSDCRSQLSVFVHLSMRFIGSYFDVKQMFRTTSTYIKLSSIAFPKAETL